MMGLGNLNLFLLPFFACFSISGPPGYLKPKTRALLSNASPRASSKVVPIL